MSTNDPPRKIVSVSQGAVYATSRRWQEL